MKPTEININQKLITKKQRLINKILKVLNKPLFEILFFEYDLSIVSLSFNSVIKFEL